MERENRTFKENQNGLKSNFRMQIQKNKALDDFFAHFFLFIPSMTDDFWLFFCIITDSTLMPSVESV